MAAPVIRHSPAPFTAPTSGDLEQRLAQIVGYINSVRSVAIRPTVAALTMTDETGQSWSVTIDSTGALSTALIPRP